MNKNNILAGLGGALVLTVLNETLKGSFENMPRIDLVGEEAVMKVAAFFGVEIEDSNTLYGTTLAGDIISNTAYYSLIDGKDNELWTKAVSAGAIAGIAAVKLPEQIGLNEEPVAKTIATKALTMGYYMAGALATAALLKLLDKQAK